MGNKNVDKFNLNIGFYLILVMIALVIVIVANSAASQNEIFESTQKEFFNGIMLYQQGQGKQAEEALAKAVRDYPDSYQVATVYAQVLYGNDKFDESLKYMRKAEKLYPAIVLNPKFIYEHARVLIANGQYGDARLYLDHIKMIDSDPDTLARANQVLQALDQYEKQGR